MMHRTNEGGSCFSNGNSGNQRCGFTTIELLIAMMIMVAVMGVTVTAIYRTDRIWRDTAQQRLALVELSNQMEELSLLPESELQKRIDELRPSEHCHHVLVGATLTGKSIDDALGRRLVLELDWRRDSPARPVRLVGWHQDVEAVRTESKSEEVAQ